MTFVELKIDGRYVPLFGVLCLDDQMPVLVMCVMSLFLSSGICGAILGLKDHESKIAHIKSFVFSCFVAHFKRLYQANSPTGGDHHLCHDHKTSVTYVCL